MSKPTKVITFLGLALLVLACNFITRRFAPSATLLSTPAVQFIPILPTTPAGPAAVTALPTQAGAPPKATPLLPGPSASLESPLLEIKMKGPVTRAEAELSGLAWYGEHLILLPQYPERFEQAGYDGTLFTLPKQAILDYLNAADPAPLEPQPIPLETNDFVQNVKGVYEGFEAIGFSEDQIFLTIEASGGSPMYGYLIKGQITPDLSEIRLDASSLSENFLQGDFSNKSDEAIFIAGGQIMTIYEINGAEFNPRPTLSRFSLDLKPLDSLPFPNLEFRVTDATAIDARSRFWVINYFYPGDVDIKPEKDPLAEKYGKGPTHTRFDTVERLVELQYSPTGVTLTNTPPVQIQLDPLGASRNWEGLARLDELGFLLVTDSFPDTILGFVRYP